MTLSSPFRLFTYALLGLAIVVVCASALSRPEDPGSPIGEQQDGSVVVPTNQTLTPIGNILKLERARPKDLAVSSDGSTIAVLCTSRVAFFTPNGERAGQVSIQAAPLGIVWSPDGTAVYASEATGKVARIQKVDRFWKITGEFPVEDKSRPLMRKGQPANPQPTGLAISADGSKLYVALGIRNAYSVLRLSDMSVLETVPLHGVSPYHVALGPGERLALSCRGGIQASPTDSTSQDSAGSRVNVNPLTDSVLSSTIEVIDQNPRTARDPRHRWFNIEGQSGGLCFNRSGDRCFVACPDRDRVEVINPLGSAYAEFPEQIDLSPGRDREYGVIPTSCTLSSNESTLYVTCGGANAIAVIRLKPRPKLEGFIPTAWYPVSVLEKDGSLVVACSKGIGARPALHERGFGVHDSVGVVQFIPANAWKNLKDLTRTVARNNRWAEERPARQAMVPKPVPDRVGEPSLFKHVVYIIKENHTYDDDFGDIPQGNGDKNLCLFGEAVTPNEHALAREFVLLDNTYTSGTNSADGHQWVASSVANDYVEHNYGAHERSYPYDGGDPLSASPRGYLWTAARQAGVSQRIYGEFVNRPHIRDLAAGRDEVAELRGDDEGAIKGRTSITWKSMWQDYKAGGKRFRITAGTDNAALRPYIHPNFIGFPSVVSDQWRADQFLADLKQFETTGDMPSFIMMLLPNNHTSGARPGMPTPRASVADNDLALGRIVDAISHSKFWKDTLILVIEDDSQLAYDHVDGHRTVAQVISPYTRRHSKVSKAYNHTSFARTIGLVLGMPALTQFDRSATPLTACFDDSPDFTPYTARPNITPLDELNPEPKALKGTARRLAERSAKLDLSDIDKADPAELTRIVWEQRKPGQKPPHTAQTSATEPDPD